MNPTIPQDQPEEAPHKPVVLVVDDTVELGLIVRLLGRRAGQEVVVCPDVPSGWEFLQQQRPDLILVDVNLPGLSGLELCRLIRDTPRLADLTLALFSGWHMPQDILTALEIGVDFVVSKELVAQPEAWEQRLREILDWTHGRRWSRLLSWLEEEKLPELPVDWLSLLNQTLRHASLKRLRPQLLRFVLLRTLRQVVSSRVGSQELETWLQPEEAQLAVNPFPLSPGGVERARVEGVIVLVVSLAEQTWCLLGTEATADFRRALASIVPGLEDFLSF